MACIGTIGGLAYSALPPYDEPVIMIGMRRGSELTSGSSAPDVSDGDLPGDAETAGLYLGQVAIRHMNPFWFSAIVPPARYFLLALQ